MKRPYGTVFLALLPLAVLAMGKEPVPSGHALLARCVEASGGGEAYRQRRSVSYRFQEKSSHEGLRVVVDGRQYFKRPTGEDLWGREETTSPLGRTLTVFGPGGAGVWDNAVAVKDPGLRDWAQAHLRENAFWFFLPHHVMESGSRVEEDGTGPFPGESKLCRKLRVRLSASAWGGDIEELSLYLDTATPTLEGAVFRRAGEDYRLRYLYRKDFFFPEWEIRDAEGRKILSFLAYDLDVSTGGADDLFDPSRAPSGGFFRRDELPTEGDEEDPDCKCKRGGLFDLRRVRSPE
ncbi:MAG TPA: hypothetical protein P5079_01230 [Elusimicrobiota bacterium]|nr:hypothetical protein [Elusimicrobiota bacterium]